MQFLQAIIQFLKKHYEKIILCVMLLGLAMAAIWMGTEITHVKESVVEETPAPVGKAKHLDPIDLSTDMMALAEVTNPPAVVLSGDHNLFNPVTWRRKPNGELLKILKTGPDALTILNINPLYTVVAYNRASGEGFYMDIQVHSVKTRQEYAKLNEKTRSGLYIVRGTKGAAENPDELQLEIPDTGEMVSITKDKPYKRVDSYTVDLKYDPESRTMLKEHVNDALNLDNEPYKIVEITNNLIRVLDTNNTKITSIKWNGSP
jgi:hypothetical protein